MAWCCPEAMWTWAGCRGLDAASSGNQSLTSYDVRKKRATCTVVCSLSIFDHESIWVAGVSPRYGRTDFNPFGTKCG